MSVELVISISSLIMSILGIALHFVRFSKERPKLTISDMICKHRPVATTVKKTGLRISFTVHNKGDRATQLNSLELQEFEKMHDLDQAVEANKSVKEDCYFNIPSRITNDRLPCTFVLRHTHGKKKFTVISKRTSKILSGGVAVW